MPCLDGILKGIHNIFFSYPVRQMPAFAYEKTNTKYCNFRMLKE